MTYPSLKRSEMPRTTLFSDAGIAEVVQLMESLCRGTEPCALGEISVEHLATGGKRIRARLALAAIDALGGDLEQGIPWGAAIELVHNASLVHDDLEDGDEKRRGQPTVWVRHGVAQAINAGDLMLSLPYRAAAFVPASDEVRWRLCASLATAVEQMSRGQSGELGMLDQLRRDDELEAAYIRTAHQKTGALFASLVEGAALLSGMSWTQAQRLGQTYLDIGLLFQMQDDVLDLYGDKGRGQRGNDLREGKVSALVVEHVKQYPADREWMFSVLSTPRAQTPERIVREAIARFEDAGALQTCLRRIASLASTLVHDAERYGNPAFAELTQELVQLVLAPISEHLPKESPAELALAHAQA